MKSVDLKIFATGLVLAVTAVTSMASADYGYDRGGRDDYGRGGYDRGGRDDRGRGGYDRGGRDDYGRGGYDRGGRDDRGRGPGPGRPPQPPPPPPPQQPPSYGGDLCRGRYVGYYSNGFQAVIDFSPSYGDSINVTVQLNGQFLSGTGTCRQYGDRAQWDFTTMGVLNRGDIYRGQMTGGQPGGASLTASKQY